MQEFYSWGTTLPETYHKALWMLQDQPIIPCPDWNTNQKECAMTMYVEHPLQEPMISRLSYCDPHSLEQYRLEMLDGILDFEVDEGKWAYTYHQRYADQYQFIIDELKRNPWSRRAVMDIRRSEDMGSEDPACWQHVQYFIRDGMLDCMVLFRSNDACKAAFMNAFALIMLQKKIADELGVEVGTYTHRANSFHCYERDFALLDGYVERWTANGGLDPFRSYETNDTLCFDYIGGWDELMAAERDSIYAAVRKLQAN